MNGAGSAATPVSACVICYREADRIEACLRSLDFCDEIVVVGSGSDDGGCDFGENGGRIVNALLVAHLVHDIADDLTVWPCARQRIDSSVDFLNAAVAVGESTAFLQE